MDNFRNIYKNIVKRLPLSILKKCVNHAEKSYTARCVLDITENELMIRTNE